MSTISENTCQQDMSERKFGAIGAMAMGFMPKGNDREHNIKALAVGMVMKSLKDKIDTIVSANRQLKSFDIYAAFNELKDDLKDAKTEIKEKTEQLMKSSDEFAEVASRHG